VFIALGSNLGDRVAHLSGAVRAVRELLRLRCVSSLWETEPVGLREQGAFLNAALGGVTELAPGALLAGLAEIEQRGGRSRDVRNGPRTIDLDLLAYGELTLAAPGLELPHPRLAERRFVLAPLAEIAPDFRPAADGPSVREMLSRLPQAEWVRPYPHPEWPPAAI
jgi:2-amino-4-hydroxy-6-hydroxymethyldihydropteridine diphosphokinase